MAARKRRKRARVTGRPKGRGRPRSPRAAQYASVSAALQKRSGLRQASFALSTNDLAPVQAAKRRFGTRTLARFLARICKELLRLCRRAEVK